MIDPRHHFTLFPKQILRTNPKMGFGGGFLVALLKIIG
jgi:hypothetical protein